MSESSVKTYDFSFSTEEAHYASRLRIGGVSIPYIPLERVKLMLPNISDNGLHNWMKLYQAEKGDRFGVDGPGFTLMSSELRYGMKELTSSDNWLKDSVRILPPNGQLKNFFVAVQTVLSFPKKRILSIAIAGSMAAAPSGMWHSFFCHWLLHSGRTGVVHYYDSSQVEEMLDYSFEGETLQSQGFQRWLAPEETASYDIVIDDTYAFGDAGSFKILSECFSQKDHSEGVLPFFHYQEGRKFSHHIFFLEPNGCKCPRCTIEFNMEAPIQWVRAITSTLSFHRCYPVEDGKALSEVFKAVNSHFHIRPATSAQTRALLSLSKTIEMASVEGGIILASGPLQFTHSEGFKGTSLEQDYFSDKSILYLGITAKALSITSSSVKKRYDVAFLTDIKSLHMAMVARVIFSLDPLPGFKTTGMSYLGFTAYERMLRVPVKKKEYVIHSRRNFIALIVNGKTVKEFPSPLMVRDFELEVGLPVSGSTSYYIEDQVYSFPYTYCSEHSILSKEHNCRQYVYCEDCGNTTLNCSHARRFLFCALCKKMKPLRDFSGNQTTHSTEFNRRCRQCLSTATSTYKVKKKR